MESKCPHQEPAPCICSNMGADLGLPIEYLSLEVAYTLRDVAEEILECHRLK